MNCSIEPCEGILMARGWCRAHYLRWYKHGDPEFLQGRVAGRGDHCSMCNAPKVGGGYCKPCAAAWRFGLTREQYDKLLLEQGGLCAICKQPETRTRNGQLIALAVDHDHKTGEFRGFLCGRCNTAIGLFRDDEELLSAAIDYLNDRKKEGW